MNKYKNIDFYTIEGQFGPNGKSLKTINQVIGVVRYILLLNGIKYYDTYTPGHIKKVVTGNGRAKKEEIQKYVCEFYNLYELQKDEADALAIAYTGYYHINKKTKEAG